MRAANRRGQTLRNVFTVMKGVFDHAVRERCLSENPVAAHRKYLLRVDEEPYEANFLSADQVEALGEFCDSGSETVRGASGTGPTSDIKKRLTG
jgi:hypothetical protein